MASAWIFPRFTSSGARFSSAGPRSHFVFDFLQCLELTHIWRAVAKGYNVQLHCDVTSKASAADAYTEGAKQLTLAIPLGDSSAAWQKFSVEELSLSANVSQIHATAIAPMAHTKPALTAWIGMTSSTSTCAASCAAPFQRWASICSHCL